MRRDPGRCAGILLAAALVLSAGPAAASRWARFALVIGYNGSDDPELTPLRYADDDAVKYAQYFEQVAERTILLTRLDASSERVFGKNPKGSIAPTRVNVLRALAELRRGVAAARARGDKPILFFVYSGHGNYDKEGRGYVHLADGRWTTRDIYFHVLGPSEGATPHHVVLMVDACNAALLVNSRGGTDRRRVRGTTLKLERYPNVGVILSSSSVGEVHEWGRYLSGIFSHEVRSGLLGPADIDDDGHVTFAELAAFIASANADVKNEVYRLKPYIRPPISAPNLPLVSIGEARFPVRVRIDRTIRGKAHVVNAELLRYADFNKSDSVDFWLGLPRGGFALVHGGREYVIPKDAHGDLRLSALQSRRAGQLAARGPSAYFEQRLFAKPHSRAKAKRWLKLRYAETLVVERLVPIPWHENWGAWSLLGGGLGVLGGAVALHVTALGTLEHVRGPGVFARDIHAANRDADTLNKAAIAMYSVGGAALLSSVLWFALDQRFRTEIYRPPLEINITPNGVLLKSTF